MDFAAHALYGATFCSQSGLAGGRQGFAASMWRDKTVWASLFWGVLPDVVSMGIPFVVFLASRQQHWGHFFMEFEGMGLLLYRWMHSLVPAGVVLLALYRFRRSMFVPALAWPLHLLTDAVTHHSSGKFRTTLFYPFTDWAIDGWPWWHSPGLIFAYWALLPTVWIGLVILRRRRLAPT